MKEIEELSKLIEQRNHIDYQIKEIINRPAITGHIGEFIASKIFDIELETSASAKSIDGKSFRGYQSLGNLCLLSMDPVGISGQDR